MLRKLAAFFFDEEEIVLEEDLKKEQEENYRIPEIKPMRAKTKESMLPKPKAKEEEIKEEIIYANQDEQNEPAEVNEPENKVAEPGQDRIRSKKITVDRDDFSVKKKEVFESKVPKAKEVQEEYQPQEIISPIFGGSEKETSKPIIIKEPIKKKRQTTVISPMYGLVEDDQDEAFNEELLNYDLSDMLSSSKDAEEVQVSLYDFLEELEDE